MDPRTWFKDLTPYFIYLLFVSTLGPLLFGFHLSELNTPEDVIRCNTDSLFIEGVSLPQCIPMNSTQWGLVGSIFTLGGLMGALAAGPVAGKYGRLVSMHWTTAFFVVGPVFEAAASNIAVLALGRLISGVGAGASVVVVPIYLSEVAPPAERGFFGAFTQIMTNVGILVAQLLGYFLSRGQYWRVILATGGFIGAVQAAGLFFGAESPKWTANEGKLSNARKTLHKIRGDDTDIDEEIRSWGIRGTPHVEEEEEALLSNESHAGHSNNKSKGKKEALGIFEVIRDLDCRPAVIAVVLVMVGQQLTGINSIIMYGVHLLSDLLKSNSALLNLLVSAVNIFVTAACAPLVDKLGRKTCLLSSITGMGVSSLLLAIGILRVVPVLSAVAVILFVSSFAVGLGPIPFILSSELVGPDAVGATQSWALVANWIATFLVAQFFPLANEKLHGKVYFIFAGVAALFWCFVAWYLPETKGKQSAEEVWGRERRVD